MIDIIGNIKVDESKPERVRWLVACIRSYLFLKNEANFVLNLHGASDSLLTIVKKELAAFPNHRLFNINDNDYGKTYCYLIDQTTNPNIINFMEDQFMVMDDAVCFSEIINLMQERKVDILKASFYDIEKNSSHFLNLIVNHYRGNIFCNDEKNHQLYQKYYGTRYYIGVNFITSREFAKKFWNRSLGPRPHDYEISTYTDSWKHICMIPHHEIQCAIDDDHGEKGTCLLKRKEPKWLQIIEQIEREYGLSENNIKIKPKTPLKFNDLCAENDLFRKSINTRINAVIDSGVYLFGNQSRELEKTLAAFVGMKHCLTVKNCTDAITMVIKILLRYKPDATVILPNFGAYPTAIAVKNCTDNLCFVDVDDTLTLDPKKLPQHIKNGIVIAVHLFGNNADMRSIKKYAHENDHIVIEDCAQSLGSGSGSDGDFSVFSFYPTKPLGAMGDGGAICTNNVDAYEDLKTMRFYGLSNGDIMQAGINSRMGELDCAVVNSKSAGFIKLNQKRHAIAERYKKIVKGMRTNGNCIYHQFPVLFNNQEQIITLLQEREIPYMIHYPRHVSEMAVFNSTPNPVGYRVNDKIVSFPCHAFMTEDHIQQIEEFLNKVKKIEI